MTTATDAPPDQPVDVGPPAPRVIRWRAAVAGVISAGVALAFGELPSGLADESVSMITAVGNRFVDGFAASLKDIAVELFGTNDKVALVVGIVVVSLGLGASLGIAAARRLAIGIAGFVAFGLVGAWAAASDPQLGVGIAVTGAILAVAAGSAALAILLPFAVERPVPTRQPNTDPTVRTPDRRAFLAFSGTAGVTAVAVAGLSRSVRGNPVEEVRASLTLPEPVDEVAVPPTTGVDVDGVTPYITPNDDFYRIDTALTVPRVDVDGWTLRVSGLVDNPFELTYDELLDMEMVERPVTLQCVSNEVGGGLVGNADWLGVPLADILDRAGVQPEGTQIVGRSVDGFTIGMPTEVALDGRTALVAVGMNAEPLPARHGFPARLVVSGLYGYVSATKWLREIELVRFEDFDAYWVPRGWAKEAPIKQTSRIDVPRPGQRAPAGRQPVAGVAWSPDIGIDAVQVRISTGAADGEWRDCRLGEAANDDTWVQWVYDWDAEPGTHRIEVRCIDKDGTVQTGDVAPPRPDGATGYHGIVARVE